MPESLPITPPTFADVKARVQADVASSTGEQDVYLPGTFARGAAYALARGIHSMYGFAARILAELMPSTAIDWGVLRWAALRGLTRTAATSTTGTVTITFTGAATVGSGAALTREDGTEYTLNAAVTRGSAGTATGTFTASVAGADGLEVADKLTLSAALANVTSATVVATVAEGGDLETLDALKERLLADLADPPQGGSEADYVAWSKAYDATIERVWIYPNEPYLGSVTVIVAVTGTGAAIIPGGTLITNLQAALRLLAPAHAAEYVFALAPTARTIEASVTLSPNTLAIRTSVTDTLDELYSSGGTIPGGTLYLDDVVDAIRRGVRAEDAEGHFTLTLLEGVAPANVSLSPLELPVIGTMTYS